MKKKNPHPEKKVRVAQASSVTHIKQLQGKLQLFKISNQ